MERVGLFPFSFSFLLEPELTFFVFGSRLLLQSKFSHENKMTLSNLLLVFCPSLCLSPPFLRLLVENHSFLLDHSPATVDSNSNLNAPSSNPPILPPRPLSSSAVLPPPSNPPPPRTSPPRKKMAAVDPPRLDVRVPSTSPLPSFATLAKEEKSRSGSTSTGWENPAKKGGLFSKLGAAPVASEGGGGPVPSAWIGGGAGSLGKKRNMSSPPRSTSSSGSNHEDGTEEILPSSSKQDRTPLFSNRKNAS